MAENGGFTYVTHTCKNKDCERAFTDIDECDSLNIPPDYKYCPVCVKSGLKNTNLKNDREMFKKKDALYSYIFENTPQEYLDYLPYIQDKALEVFNREMELGRKFNSKSILNQVIEVLGYHLEANNGTLESSEVFEY